MGLARFHNVSTITMVSGIIGLGNNGACAVIDSLQGASAMSIRGKGWRRRTNATGKHVALHKGLLEPFHADTLGIHHVLRRSTGKKARELVVKLDKVLSNLTTLALIRLQDRSLAGAFDYTCDFPA